MRGRRVGVLCAVGALAALAIAWGLLAERGRPVDPSAAGESGGVRRSAPPPGGSGRGALAGAPAARAERRAQIAARLAALRASPQLREALAEASREPAASARRERPGGRPQRSAERPSRRRLALLEQIGAIRRSGEPVEIAGVRHTPYALWKSGLPVLNRRGRLHEQGGEPLGAAGGLSLPPLEEGERRIGRDAAVSLARAAVGARALRAAPRTQLGWLARPGGSVPAWSIALPSAEPFASFEVALDARSGRVLAQVDRLLRAEGTGFVFHPNAVEAKAPALVPLRALDGSGLLAGEIARVVDERSVEAFAPDLSFAYPPDDPRFGQTSLYRGLTETGLFAVAHGFAPFPQPLLAFANVANGATGGEYNNAFYDPALKLFVFGNGDGTVLRNLATDLDVPAHEMGHHVFETLVAPLVFSDEDPVLAMHEGVADTFSLFVGGDADVGESVVPGARYLRSLKSRARYPDGYHPDPHVTGLIYGGANYELSRSLRGAFPDVLIASLPFLPPDPFEADYRDAVLAGDRAVTGGAFERTISQVFQKRGFDTVEPPPEYQGPLDDGIPRSGSLPDDAYHFYVFYELPGSAALRAALVGTGDADLIVGNEDFDPDDPSTYAVSDGLTSSELIQLGRTSVPSIDDGDLWFVAVADYPDGRASTYTLTVSATLAPDGISIGGLPVAGEIHEVAEIDYFVFSGSAGQVVRVEAQALDATLDPLIAVLDTEDQEVLAFDDDSGPGRDALIEGVRLPRTGRFALAVLSLVADFDPRIGTGRYALSLGACANLGADRDGDGLADACDGDEDGDGFLDPDDAAPGDADRCADLDVDGCDDCESGSWDFLADGSDADADGVCDPGDDDDDNDGCADASDPDPDETSADPDLDFLGADCDNCPDVPNPLQSDADHDGLGDACASCARLHWTEPALEPPDQNPVKSLIDLKSPGTPGRTSLRASGRFAPAGAATPDPAASGVFVRLADREGLLGEWWLPPGLLGAPGAGCGPQDGWSRKSSRGGTAWGYASRSGALPQAGCAPGSAAGLARATLTATPAGLAYDVQVSSAALARAPALPLRFLHLDLVLGQPGDGAAPSPEGEAGLCAESVLWLSRPGSACKVSAKSGVLSSASCRSLP